MYIENLIKPLTQEKLWWRLGYKCWRSFFHCQVLSFDTHIAGVMKIHLICHIIAAVILDIFLLNKAKNTTDDFVSLFMKLICHSVNRQVK